MDYKEKVRSLPDSPGVYIMEDNKGGALYIGKAKDLKRRVSSYFYKPGRLSERLEAMIQKVEDITYIPTSTEAEALIYENGLIKRLSPRYNIALRDDKSYPMLKLTTNEKFPRLFITRQKRGDGAVYFGPYTNVKLLREALAILRRIFPLRTCNKMPDSLCLNYHLRQCVAPCVGKVAEDSYKEIVLELKLFLEGKRTELLKLLSERMAVLARSQNFEEAAQLRNRIEALSAMERRVAYSPADEVEELRRLLGITKNIERIEAFDVSNIMGKTAVGSIVHFYKGRPKKSEYRRFKIKTVSKMDDYAMMRELIYRRYRRLLNEKGILPDLILIDGGRGHLSVATNELKKLGLSNIPAIGIAKEFEHLYLKEAKNPVTLPKEAKALHLLERIRDEAHRFAISYHKRLLSKGIELSELDNIESIGPKRKRALFNYFGSLDKIKNVKDTKEFLKIKEMDEKSARNIIEYFKR
ncbi:MAG: excinuclease ABC subunit UvrC [Candidatus Omnitrophica bacterium]|nr:excinuclease ABC subunit UvrC [Candidatus Omnitrophota bacterium]